MSRALQASLVLACGVLAGAGMGWLVVQMLGAATVVALVLGRRSASKAWAVHDALEQLSSRPPTEASAELERALRSLGVETARGQIVLTHVISRLVDVHRYDLANAWLEHVRGARLPSVWQPILASAGAEVALWHGDRSRARTFLGGLARPAEPAAWESRIAAQELLLDALEGAPAIEPKVRLALLRAEPENRSRAVLQIAHAHALARLDRIEAAASLLRALDPGNLFCASRHRGPASELARQMYASKN